MQKYEEKNDYNKLSCKQKYITVKIQFIQQYEEVNINSLLEIGLA